MRILVLSDSHGCVDPMQQCVELVQPQAILHLGDCWRDAERLAERYPDIPMEHVPGNCDCRPGEPAEKLLFLGDCRVLICHGHTCGVKTSLLTAGLKADSTQAKAVRMCSGTPVSRVALAMASLTFSGTLMIIEAHP